MLVGAPPEYEGEDEDWRIDSAVLLSDVFPEMNMSAAFYTRRRQCFTVAAEKFDTCGGGI